MGLIPLSVPPRRILITLAPPAPGDISERDTSPGPPGLAPGLHLGLCLQRHFCTAVVREERKLLVGGKKRPRTRTRWDGVHCGSWRAGDELTRRLRSHVRRGAGSRSLQRPFPSPLFSSVRLFDFPGVSAAEDDGDDDAPTGGPRRPDVPFRVAQSTKYPFRR